MRLSNDSGWPRDVAVCHQTRPFWRKIRFWKEKIYVCVWFTFCFNHTDLKLIMRCLVLLFTSFFSLLALTSADMEEASWSKVLFAQFFNRSWSTSQAVENYFSSNSVNFLIKADQNLRQWRTISRAQRWFCFGVRFHPCSCCQHSGEAGGARGQDRYYSTQKRMKMWERESTPSLPVCRL